MMQESVKKILVIEDNAITRNLFLDGLQSEGFETIGANNGLTGIQLAQEHSPDLIICDIIMPDMDGYAVLSALRQEPITAIIPFIFLTGSNTAEDVRKGMELGADDYLSKPCTVDQLLRAITTRLEKQTQIRYWCAINSHKISASLPTPKTSTEEALEFNFPTVPQLKEVFDYIEAHYQEGITLCDVAQAVGYSSAYLTNRVAKKTGDTVNTWIVKRRMAAARYLLQNSDQSIEQIATSLGYQNACHFSRQFRQHNEIPPQSWRKKHQFRLENVGAV
ncbi:MAG: response regulator transcription factor [Hassallia sp.]